MLSGYRNSSSDLRVRSVDDCTPTAVKEVADAVHSSFDFTKLLADVGHVLLRDDDRRQLPDRRGVDQVREVFGLEEPSMLFDAILAHRHRTESISVCGPRELAIDDHLHQLAAVVSFGHEQ